MWSFYLWQQCIVMAAIATSCSIEVFCSTPEWVVTMPLVWCLILVKGHLPVVLTYTNSSKNREKLYPTFAHNHGQCRWSYLPSGNAEFVCFYWNLKLFDVELTRTMFQSMHNRWTRLMCSGTQPRWWIQICSLADYTLILLYCQMCEKIIHSWKIMMQYLTIWNSIIKQIEGV